MEKSHELTVAKINAATKILEWAKDDIEPGIDGVPKEMHLALAEAFKAVYRMVGEAVAEGELVSAEPEPARTP